MADLSDNMQISCYAGYYINDCKLKESSSGGAATAIAEAIIRLGGVVYGVRYSSDYYGAEYERVDSLCDLGLLKGSKYISVQKRIRRGGKYLSLYDMISDDLTNDRIVLFIGLGCDVAALISCMQIKGVNTGKLHTIELLCGGVTSELVQKEYVLELERRNSSKVTEFSVRYKKEGWHPFYIRAMFENGNIYNRPFYKSDYGYAFVNYKRKSCYQCKFKNEHHQGDLILGDYWGCEPGMKAYNSYGVSLIVVREKGDYLVDLIDTNEFQLYKIEAPFALLHNQRYFSPPAYFKKWEVFNDEIKQHGLRKAVQSCEMKSWDHIKRKVIMWGAGNCFRENCCIVREMCHVDSVCDSNKEKWGKELEKDIYCISPDKLKTEKNIFVLIMLDDIRAAFQVAQKLIEMNIFAFDVFSNWIHYADEKMYY